VSVVKNTARQMYDAGAALLEGLRQGFISKLADVIAAVQHAAQQIFAAASGALGVHSPSTLFAGLGQQMMAGMAQGIQGGLSAPQLAMAGVVPSLAAAAAGSTYNFYPSVRDDLDLELLARRIAQLNYDRRA